MNIKKLILDVLTYIPMASVSFVIWLCIGFLSFLLGKFDDIFTIWQFTFYLILFVTPLELRMSIKLKDRGGSFL